jgi:hypothetical protein
MRHPRVLVCALNLLLLDCLSLHGQTSPVKIPDATAIRLTLSESLSSATNNVDDPVRFEVTEDVKTADVIVIPKGATAVGHVVEVEPKRRMGRAGKVNFTIDHVKAADGSNIRLRASTTRKGEDKTGTVIIGSAVFSPLFLIMRGKDIEIAKGTPFAAYVDGDREIWSRAPNASDTAGKNAAQSGAKSTEMSTVIVRSEPQGADVSADGKFLGNTPSTIQLSPGDHVVLIELPGYNVWQRSITMTPGGIVTLNATLEKK